MKYVVWAVLLIALLGCSTAHKGGTGVGEKYSQPSAGEHNVLTNAKVGIQNGNLAPDFTITTLTGEKINLRSFSEEGKPVLIHFFATWCPFCREDFSVLSTVYGEYENDVAIVAMSLDDKESKKKLSSYKQTFPGLEEVKFATTRSNVLKDYNVRYTTTKYAIGKDGTIIYSGSGAFKVDQWRVLLDSLKSS